MRSASIDDIKKELKELPPKKVLELLLRVARFKKENKELLTYLLFEAHNEQNYIRLLKADINEQFAEVSPTPTSQAKKHYRKILRGINRQIKYIGSKAAGVELLLHFASILRDQDSSLHPKLETIFLQQLAKAEKLLPTVDDDLKFDFQQQIDSLRGDNSKVVSFKKKFFRFR